MYYVIKKKYILSNLLTVSFKDFIWSLIFIAILNLCKYSSLIFIFIFKCHLFFFKAIYQDTELFIVFIVHVLISGIWDTTPTLDANLS